MKAPAIVSPRAALDAGNIWRATLNLKWDVLRVLEDWTTPVHWSALGMPGDTRRFRVLVSGPLPARPAETGEFVMVVLGTGDRSGWRVAPEGKA